MKRVTVIADDFGFNAHVSAGILDVLATGRVDGTGCMAAGPAFASHAAALRQAGVQVGLHLDLNTFVGWPGLPIGPLAACAYADLLDAAYLRHCVRLQLDAFEQHLHRPPDFIDGHQHVHQLPAVRRALLAELALRGAAPALRRTRPAHWRGAKAAVIGGLGGRGLERLAAAQGLPMQNTDFAGVYGFDPSQAYAQRVAHWLAGLDDGGLVMTHPARPGAASAHDTIREARWREHAFWLSGEAQALRCGERGPSGAAQGKPAQRPEPEG